MPQLGVAYTPTPKLSEAAEDAPLKELAEAEPRDVPSAFVEMFAPKPLDVAFASDATAKAAGVAPCAAVRALLFRLIQALAPLELLQSSHDLLAP